MKIFLIISGGVPHILIYNVHSSLRITFFSRCMRYSISLGIMNTSSVVVLSGNAPSDWINPVNINWVAAWNVIALEIFLSDRKIAGLLKPWRVSRCKVQENYLERQFVRLLDSWNNMRRLQYAHAVGSCGVNKVTGDIRTCAMRRQGNP